MGDFLKIHQVIGINDDIVMTMAKRMTSNLV